MILVTGSKGFIGSNLVRRFSPEDVICVDMEDCYRAIANVDWRNVDKIYHCGAISSTVEKDIHKIYMYNIDYSIKLFNIAIEHKIPVVYLSSASVFGNSTAYQYNPLNYYATSKVMIDHFVQENIDKFSNIVVIRPYNVYGDGELHKGSQASPLTQFQEQVKKAGEIRVFKFSENFIRDFIWVEDLIDCMLTEKESGFYDGGTSNPVSFMSIAKLIGDKYNCPIKIIPFPDNLKGKYQYYTCSRKHFDKQFMKPEEYLNRG